MKKYNFAGDNDFLDLLYFQQRYQEIDPSDKCRVLGCHVTYDWTDIFLSEDIEQVWNSWKNSFFNVLNKCIPSKSVTLKNTKNAKWMNRELKLLKRKEHRAYKVFRRKRTQSSRKSYIKCRKLVQLKMKSAEENYISNICDDLRKKPKRFWQFVNSKQCDKVAIGSLKCGDNVLTNNIDKAECLNEQFKSVFNDYVPSNTDKSSDSQFVPAYMENDKFNEQEVFDELRWLDASKACGPDGIKPVFLKVAAKQIAKPLCRLFNLSYQKGIVPADWRNANISPVHKKGPKSDPKNYRPVSLTSIICKIMEKLVRKRLLNHLNKHDLICENQHGFRSKHSCETQLLQSLNDWCEILDKKSSTDVIFLDISRAFDVVSHPHLLYKLQNMGISSTMCSWVSAFLTGRKQCVKIGNAYSSSAAVTSGVPQGTILGPVLFLVYINDIVKDLRCTCRLYADDCVLYKEVKTVNDAEMLQEDLNKINLWAKQWKMSFNVDKCRVMHISKKKSNIDFNYELNNVPLKITKSERYLGVTISDKLSWSVHIQNVKRDCYSKLGLINRVFGRCSLYVKTKLYQQLVLPKLDYCSSVWSPGSVGLMKELEKVQRRASGIILANNSSSYVNNIARLKWQPIYVRHKISRMILLFKIVNNLISVDYSKYFKSRNVHRVLRNSNDRQLQYKFAATNVCQNSFFYKCINEWNNLPNDIVNSASLNTFKHKLTLHVNNGSFRDCAICQCL
jgi:hypothetical protein